MSITTRWELTPRVHLTDEHVTKKADGNNGMAASTFILAVVAEGSALSRQSACDVDKSGNGLPTECRSETTRSANSSSLVWEESLPFEQPGRSAGISFVIPRLCRTVT